MTIFPRELFDDDKLDEDKGGKEKKPLLDSKELIRLRPPMTRSDDEEEEEPDLGHPHQQEPEIPTNLSSRKCPGPKFENNSTNWNTSPSAFPLSRAETTPEETTKEEPMKINLSSSVAERSWNKKLII